MKNRTRKDYTCVSSPIFKLSLEMLSKCLNKAQSSCYEIGIEAQCYKIFDHFRLKYKENEQKLGKSMGVAGQVAVIFKILKLNWSNMELLIKNVYLLGRSKMTSPQI